MDRFPSKPTRRQLLQGATAAAAAPLLAGLSEAAAQTPGSAMTILRVPDVVRAFGPEGEIHLTKTGEGTWEGAGAAISAVAKAGEVQLTLAGSSTISRLQFRWHGDLTAIKLYLGDHWERAYADLQWQGEAPNRTMPWYFMAYDGKKTHGYGVKTGAGAMCFWNADAQGISLWADVRSGGNPANLSHRKLLVAHVIERHGSDHESSQSATHAFCRQMCEKPRLADHAIYGTNDWNYAYGNSSADLIANVSGLISELSSNTDNRPYSVVDEGWAMGPYNNNFGYGPWEGNPHFGDMGNFATRLKGLGVRPGIWFRPLTPLDDTPKSWRITRNHEYLDPTIPEVKDHVAKHVKRFTGWGYEMIKHDFSTWDVLGKWGFQMGPQITNDGWSLADNTKTNAEAFTDLYQTLREAAGTTRLIGCNTVSHLSAGYHELQRIGDDTSGRSWDRNRRMGVNCLAFRAPQHGAFYSCDPDIVAITKEVSWDLVEQWMRLVSSSGTTLFVAADPSIVEAKHKVALKKALALAAHQQPIAEPLDWMESMTPRHWKLLGKTESFAWMDPNGPWPFGD